MAIFSEQDSTFVNISSCYTHKIAATLYFAQTINIRTIGPTRKLMINWENVETVWNNSNQYSIKLFLDQWCEDENETIHKSCYEKLFLLLL